VDQRRLVADGVVLDVPVIRVGAGRPESRPLAPLQLAVERRGPLVERRPLAHVRLRPPLSAAACSHSGCGTDRGRAQARAGMPNRPRAGGGRQRGARMSAARGTPSGGGGGGGGFEEDPKGRGGRSGGGGRSPAGTGPRAPPAAPPRQYTPSPYSSGCRSQNVI